MQKKEKNRLIGSLITFHSEIFFTFGYDFPRNLFIMKYLLLLLACFLLFSFNGEIKTKSDLADENIKGKVKCITETTYQYKRPKYRTKGDSTWWTFITYYNPAGNYERRELYYGKVLSYKYQYIYDEHNNLTHEWDLTIPRVDTLKPGDSIIGNNYVYRYEYDAKGNVLFETSSVYNRFADGIKRIKYEMKYDDAGNMTEQKWYWTRDSSLQNTFTFKYDGEGNMTEEYCYDKKGKLSYVQRRQYNNKGYMTCQLIYNNRDSLLRKEEGVHYDDNGNNIGNYPSEWYEYPNVDAEGNWLTMYLRDNISVIPRERHERTIEYY
jgi:hypothetical protein